MTRVCAIYTVITRFNEKAVRVRGDSAPWSRWAFVLWQLGSFVIFLCSALAPLCTKFLRHDHNYNHYFSLWREYEPRIRSSHSHDVSTFPSPSVFLRLSPFCLTDIVLCASFPLYDAFSAFEAVYWSPRCSVRIPAIPDFAESMKTRPFSGRLTTISLTVTRKL